MILGVHGMELRMNKLMAVGRLMGVFRVRPPSGREVHTHFPK